MITTITTTASLLFPGASSRVGRRGKVSHEDGHWGPWLTDGTGHTLPHAHTGTLTYITHFWRAFSTAAPVKTRQRGSERGHTTLVRSSSAKKHYGNTREAVGNTGVRGSEREGGRGLVLLRGPPPVEYLLDFFLSPAFFNWLHRRISSKQYRNKLRLYAIFWCVLSVCTYVCVCVASAFDCLRWWWRRCD